MFENRNSDNVLNDLEDSGLIEFDKATGLPVKTDPARHLREIEVCCLILPYVIQNIKISSREIARQTGLDPRTVNRYRSSETFAKLLIEHTNKQMLNVRCLAVEELGKILRDEKVNPNTKIKAIHEALSHTERMTELMIMAKKDVPVINVDTILKEIENM